MRVGLLQPPASADARKRTAQRLMSPPFDNCAVRFLALLTFKVDRIRRRYVEPKRRIDLEFDPDGNVWLLTMYQAGMRARQSEVKVYPFPKEWQSPSTQASMVLPMHRSAPTACRLLSRTTSINWNSKGRAYAAATPRPAR
jgi:hypothetical protein